MIQLSQSTRELEAFLALEAPFLLPVVPRLGNDPEGELLAALYEALPEPPPHSLHPDATAREAVGWTRATLETLICGFFSRQEIRAQLTEAERRDLYRVMLLSRALDDTLKRLFMEKKVAWNGYPSPQKGFRAFGQEAAAGLALRLRRGWDVVAPLIRGLPVLLMVMDDPLSVLLVQAGKAGTPMDGRDLHVGDLDRGVLPPTAPLAIATQTLLGMAYAWKLRGEDRVGVCFMGEGGTSLGEWHEAINFAAVQKLNMVFVVENNHWALGTHWREQTAAPRFALKAAGYGIPWVTVFGNDADDVAAAGTWAAEHARAGRGPVLVELVTYRRSGHAHHDDDRFHGAAGMPGYELEEERRTWEAADPLRLYEERLHLPPAERERMAQEARQRVDEAERKMLDAPWPEPSAEIFALRTEPIREPGTATKVMSYDEAIRQAMIEMMEADERVFVLGEDVGGRYGGSFGVTRGLAKQFGLLRCLNTILAESAIVGCGVGAALQGMRPIVEMQFADFLACGFNALVNNAAKNYWRYRKPVPLVVRLPYGGATGTMNRLLGGGPYHSQCPEAWFLRTPGWKIVAPATPSDAKGLMTAALRDNNPVLFLEAKGLYGIFRPDLKEPVALGTEFEVPIGQALMRRAGRDATCVTYGPMVWASLAAAETLAKEGIELEVIDLRTIVPMDMAAILDSVRRTNRLVIVHEDTRTGGVGSEIAARVAEQAVWDLDAPIVRVGAPDTPVPYSPPLEYAWLPKAEDVVKAVRDLCAG
ncbi:MAG: alpha-ketoacid dehydrogenase subunit alpha/beta [Candidatus Xenobia bacterium]